MTKPSLLFRYIECSLRIKQKLFCHLTRTGEKVYEKVDKVYTTPRGKLTKNFVTFFHYTCYFNGRLLLQGMARIWNYRTFKTLQCTSKKLRPYFADHFISDYRKHKCIIRFQGLSYSINGRADSRIPEARRPTNSRTSWAFLSLEDNVQLLRSLRIKPSFWKTRKTKSSEAFDRR